MLTPEQKVEALFSFDPIFTKLNGRTMIFAKQNNRLFRIAFSVSKPRFYVVSKTALVPMTSADVESIIDNYAGFSLGMKHMLNQLPKMYATFKAKKEQPDSNQAPFIYAKLCQEIVDHPQFSEAVKLTHAEKAESVHEARVLSVTPKKDKKPVQPSGLPVAKKSAPVFEKAHVSTEKAKPVVAQNGQPDVRPLIDPAKAQALIQDLSPFDPIALHKNVLYAKRKNRLFRIEFNQKPTFYAIEGDIIEPMTKDDLFDLFFGYEGADDRTDALMENVASLYQETKQQGALIAPVRLPEFYAKIYAEMMSNPSFAAQHCFRMNAVKRVPFEEKKSSEYASVDTSVSVVSKGQTEKTSTTIAQHANVAMPDKVQPAPKTPADVASGSQISKPHEPPKTFDFIGKQQKAKQQYEWIDGLPVIEGYRVTPVKKGGASVWGNSQIKYRMIGKKLYRLDPIAVEKTPVPVASIASKEPAPAPVASIASKEQTLAPTAPVAPIVSVEPAPAPTATIAPVIAEENNAQQIDLKSFYGTTDALPSWEAVYQIRNLKTTIHPTSSQAAMSGTDKPVIYNEGLIVFAQDDAEYMISVNINRPGSYKRDKASGKLVRLSADDVLDVLYPMLLKEKEEVRTAVFEMLDQLNNVVYKPVKQKSYPTVWQVIEKANLSCVKNAKKEPDIMPTYCVGSIIMARYDGCYYKAVISDQPVFEVWENGSVRPMIVNDMLRLAGDIRRGSAGQALKEMHFLSLRKFFLSKVYRQNFKLPSTDYLRRADAQTFGELMLSVYQALLPSKRKAPVKRLTNKIETKVVLSQLSLSDELVLAEQFYGDSGFLPASNIEREINSLKRAYMTKISGYADLSLRRLFVASDNCLYVIKNHCYYVISLDPEQPLFLKCKEKNNSYLYREEALDIAAQLFQEPSVRDKYVAFFGELYDNREKRSKRRPNAPLPTIRQVLEKAKYTGLLADAPSLQDIEPVICAEQVIVAKTGAIFYKIDLREPGAFEALENGVKRDMTLPEVKTVFRNIQHTYSAPFLRRNQVRDFTGRYKRWCQLDPQERLMPQSEPNVLPSIVAFLADYARAGTQIEETDLMMKDNNELARETDNTFMTADLTRQIEIAASFWPDDGSFIDAPVQNEIEQLATSVNDLTAYEPLKYPFVAQDQCLYVKSGMDTVIISVNPERPYFVRVSPEHVRRFISETQLKAVLQSLLENETTVDDARKKAVIDWYTSALEKLSTAFVKGRIGVRTVPTVRQLLAKNYLMALKNHQDYLSDISATICAGGLVCSKKGGVLYKIVLGANPQYWAYSNGMVRPMTSTEAGMVNRELLNNYDQNWLHYWNANGLKKLYNMPENIEPSPLAIKALPPVRDFFNFNQPRQMTDALLSAVDVQSEAVDHDQKATVKPMLQGEEVPFGTPMAVADFLYHPDDVARNWFAMQIGSLKKQLLTGERYPEKGTFRDQFFSVDPIIVENNMLFYRENKSIYFVSLDLRSPVFLKIESKRQTTISPQELIRLANKLFPDDLERRVQVLSYWAKVYHTYKPSRRDYRHDYPTPVQAVEIAQLKKQLQGKKDFVLEPTICAGQFVIAHYDGAWYRWNYGENPSFSVLGNGILMKATADELSAFYQRLRGQYAEVRLTVHALNLHKVEEVEKRLNKFPIIFMKPEQTLSLPDQVFMAFQQTVPPVDLTKEQANLFLIDTAENQMRETRSASTLFFEDGDALPNYAYILKIRELERQLNPQDQQPLTPIIANDDRLYFETGTHQIALSLDETKPYAGMWCVQDHCNTALIWNSLFEQMQQAFSQIPPAQIAAIHDRMRQLYQNIFGTPFQRNFAKAEPPRFDQVIALRDLQAKVDPSVAVDMLPPTICAGNIIYAQYGSVYHKISLTPPMKFETLEHGQVRAMTAVELDGILSDFSTHVSLKKLKKRQIRKAFEQQNLNGYVLTIVPQGIRPPKPYQLPDQSTVFRLLTHRLEETYPNLEEYENKSEIKELCFDLEAKLKQYFAKNISDDLKFRPEYDFYGYDVYYPNYDKQLQIETLRRSQARHNPDLKSDENNDYELPTLYGEDGRFHIKKGIKHYIIGLNPEKLSFKGRFPTLMEYKLSLSELTDMLIGEIADEALAAEVRAVLPKIYKEFLTYADRTRRAFGEKLPRFDQVEELLSLQTGIAHPDVNPVICSGGLMCARFDGVYYKITLTNDPTFEALENGAVREMTADEFNRILNAIRSNRIYKYLKRHQIPSLSSAFYRKRQHETGENKSQMLEKQTDLSLFETLPMFSQLLVGRKEGVDIPATICSDKFIRARYNGVYFEMPVDDFKAARALRDRVRTGITLMELAKLVTDLVATYDADFLLKIGATTQLSQMYELPQAYTSQPSVEPTQHLSDRTPEVLDTTHTTDTAAVRVADADNMKSNKAGDQSGQNMSDDKTGTVDVSTETTDAVVTDRLTDVPKATTVEVATKEATINATPVSEKDETASVDEKETSIQKVSAIKTDEETTPKRLRRRSGKVPVISAVEEEISAEEKHAQGFELLKRYLQLRNEVKQPVVPLTELPTEQLPDLPQWAIAADGELAQFLKQANPLPTFRYLYNIRSLDCQIQAGRVLSKQEFINSFEMAPVLCGKGLLADVKHGQIRTISLDVAYPRFASVNIATKQEERLSWEEVSHMITAWLSDETQAKRLTDALAPVYEKSVAEGMNMKMPYVKPAFREVFQYYWLKSYFQADVLNDPSAPSAERFSMAPVMCTSDCIMAKRGSCFYRISITGEEMSDIHFESLSDKNKRLMMEPEFNMMVYEIGAVKLFGSHTGVILNMLKYMYNQALSEQEAQRAAELWATRKQFNDGIPVVKASQRKHMPKNNGNAINEREE